MNVFSLEEEECNELFITQTPRENLVEQIVENDEDLALLQSNQFGIYGNDFGSLMVSFVKDKNCDGKAQYLDISEAEDFEEGNRYVYS